LATHTGDEFDEDGDEWNEEKAEPLTLTASEIELAEGKHCWEVELPSRRTRDRSSLALYAAATAAAAPADGPWALTAVADGARYGPVSTVLCCPYSLGPPGSAYPKDRRCPSGRNSRLARACLPQAPTGLDPVRGLWAGGTSKRSESFNGFLSRILGCVELHPLVLGRTGLLECFCRIDSSGSHAFDIPACCCCRSR
jgi:hypothetical protein